MMINEYGRSTGRAIVRYFSVQHCMPLVRIIVQALACARMGLNANHAVIFVNFDVTQAVRFITSGRLVLKDRLLAIRRLAARRLASGAAVTPRGHKFGSDGADEADVLAPWT